MPRIDAGSVFRCDYSNLEQVINLAKRMGKGMTVFKHPERSNFNITHTEREDRLIGMEILYRT